MCTLRIGRLLSVAITILGLTACGTDKAGSADPTAPSPAQIPPTTLTGNWFLAGSRSPAVYPTLSVFLYVQGGTVTGHAAFSTQCTTTGLSYTMSSSEMAVSGTIANDGTFAVSGTIGGTGTLGTYALSLTGTSPLPTSPSVWNGTYSLAFTPGSTGAPCSIAQTSTFAATQIAPVTGTYIGVPAYPTLPGPFGAGAAVSVQITQGAPVLVTQGGISSYQIPLTAKLTVANSSCPLSATTTGVPEPSLLAGDSFTLVLTSGFPYGFLSGTLNDPTANSFFGDLTSLANTNGCPGIAFYTFTRM